MLKRIFAALLCAMVGAGSGVAQTCETRDHAEYSKQIREFTTDKSFQTELTDHLPFNSCVPAPDAFLHHVIGAPNILDYSKDINGYMRLLASKSPRVKVFDIGKTEEGREMILVAVSDEANLAALDRYREITAKLADPRKISEQDADKLIAEGKPFYWADGSIHSPETGSPEMLMELAYRLAVEDTPFIQQIRKDSIVLITPLVEVDGHDRYVDIYMHHVKNPDAPMYPLTWWGHYVSHDNNRDQLTMSLALSRNMTNAFLQFHPQVMHDLHESVPFLYVMTGTGPYNAWLDPIVISEFQQMAYYEIEQMTRRGVIGVWTHGFYDGWAPNYLLYIGTGHNSIGRFYETFGNGGADTRERTISPAQTTREWYRPNPPLAKVKWSIRNNINMQQSALLFGMYNVASNGREFLRNFYLKSKRAVAKGREEGPAAWIFPADDARPGEQAKLLQLLQGQGVEVSRLEKEFRLAPEASRQSPSTASRQQQAPAPAPASARPDAGGKPDSRNRRTAAGPKPEPSPKSDTQPGQVLPAGSYVVRMDQPYSRWADMVLDTQYYSARDPRSYDDTGWTLGALYNVKAVRVTDTGLLDAPMKTVTGPLAVAGAVNGAGKTYLINHTGENALATLRFKLANAKMEAAEQPFEVDGQKFRAGTFILRDVDRAQLESSARELGLTVHATNAELKTPTHPLATPRIALVHGWQNTQNDGWYRIAFEQLKIPYTYIADTKLRETPALRQQFDVIVLPPMGGFGGNALNSILRGLPMRGGPMPWKNTAEMPNMVAPGLDSTEDIRGGLGYSGLSNLEKFVSDGGLLIAATSSAAVPVNGGMTEMLSISEPRGLTAPGSVVLANVEDKKSPIAYGYDDKLYVYFREGPLFRVGMGTSSRFGGEEPAGRSSGRGSASDPDVIQARKHAPAERPPRRTPREQELYVPDEIMQYARWSVPPKEEWPRVVLRFAADKDLLLSGLVQPVNEVAEKPAVIDVPHGKGHVVLFASNPMWRAETAGSYFLLFNAALNYDHLDAGREAPSPDRKPATAPAGEEE